MRIEIEHNDTQHQSLAPLSMNDSQHNRALQKAKCRYDEFRALYSHAECRYGECNYAECRGTNRK
jgi:hypothetical protein